MRAAALALALALVLCQLASVFAQIVDFRPGASLCSEGNTVQIGDEVAWTFNGIENETTVVTCPFSEMREILLTGDYDFQARAIVRNFTDRFFPIIDSTAGFRVEFQEEEFLHYTLSGFRLHLAFFAAPLDRAVDLFLSCRSFLCEVAIDGEQRGSLNVTGDPPFESDIVEIGRGKSGATEITNGQVFFVRVEGRAPTAAPSQGLTQSDAPLFPPQDPPRGSTGTVTVSVPALLGGSAVLLGLFAAAAVLIWRRASRAAVPPATPDMGGHDPSRSGSSWHSLSSSGPVFVATPCPSPPDSDLGALGVAARPAGQGRRMPFAEAHAGGSIISSDFGKVLPLPDF